jgi:propanol-preferring alcohol dehydrogenase
VRAVRLIEPSRALQLVHAPDPEPGPGQVRVRVRACAVCRTDLHVIDGDLPPLRSPITPGHEIVGVVEAAGAGVDRALLGIRVGVGWLAKSCGVCSYCVSGHENLCDAPEFTGYTQDGGFADCVIAHADFVYPLPESGSDAELAPLMCAGLIGWRSLRFAGDAEKLGFYGFGAAAHIVLQVAKWQGRRCFVFTRPEDSESQTFARALGADWTGGSDEAPPEPLDAAIIYAPVGALAPAALKAVRKGGRVVCAGIHMSDIPSFPYRLLWEERSLLSVANLTRKDAREFLRIAPLAGVKTHITTYPLEQAATALNDLRSGRLQGAAVLIP